MIDFGAIGEIAGRKQVTNADVARQNIVDVLGIKAPAMPSYNTTPTINRADLAMQMPRISDFKEPERGGGIFDVPVLGDFISLVDKPRSFIVSTVKEFGDIFKDDQSFSLSEWWNQGQKHIMMGEVFRDWDIGPEGLEGFIFGLAFDIALDPLTYMAGAGLAARAAKADDVSTALLQVARKAEDAGDATKAARLLRAEEAVTRSGSILAAGESLADIGIQSGLRFTIPATGRLGRTIIEKPLRALNPRLGNWLDVKRVGQLSPQLTKVKTTKGPLSFLDDALDTTDNVVQKQILQRMDDIRNNVPLGTTATATGKAVDVAARKAMNMPVEAFKIPFSTGRVLATGTGALGKTWRGLYATKYGYRIANNLSTKAAFTKSKGRKDLIDRLGGLYGYEIMGGADASAGAWKNFTLNEFEKIARKVDAAGADLGVIMRGAEMPLYQGVDAAGKPLINPALVALDPIFGTDKGIALWELFSKEGSGFWHQISDEWNDLLPYSGMQTTLERLKGEFYNPHYLTDEGYKAVKRIRPDDPMTGAETAGKGGLRGSATTERNARTPAGIVATLKDDWVDFRFGTATPFNKILKAMQRTKKYPNLDRNVDKDTFLEYLQDYLNSNPVEFKYKSQGRERSFHNRITDKRPIQDYDVAGGLDVRGQWQKYGGEEDPFGYVDDIFEGDPRSIITRYVTQMDSTFRTEYALDAFQEAGILVRGMTGPDGNMSIFRDTFGQYSEKLAAMFGLLQRQTWDGTEFGKKGVSKKYRGTVRQQEDIDRIAAEINDLENAIDWLDNLDDPTNPLSALKSDATISQADINQARNIVTDLAQVEGVIIDLMAAIAALQKGTLKGLSPRAKALIEGEEIIIDLTGREVKRAAKDTAKKSGREVPQGLSPQVRIRLPRPQTKTPSTTELADALRNRKASLGAQEEVALLIKSYGDMIISLKALTNAIGDQIALVGKTVVKKQEFQPDLWRQGKIVEEGVGPKNISDINQGESLGSLVKKITNDPSPTAAGTTPSEYLSLYQKRVERKIAQLTKVVDSLQSKLASNVVKTDPTAVVADLITKINLKMSPNLESLADFLKGLDTGTLNFIRDSLENLRQIGPTAVKDARRGVADLPDPLTEELIKFIVGVTKGTGPTAMVQAKNLPLDILEQLAVKMGPKAGGPLQQWVKSVKQLEKLYKQLGARIDDHLVPSLDEARNLRTQVTEALTSDTEDLVRAFAVELKAQVAKGLGSPKNREVLAGLENWAFDLERVRIAGLETMENMKVKWQERLDDAVRRGAEASELALLNEMRVNDLWAQMKQLRSEYNDMLSSPVLKDRIRAQERHLDAVKLLGDRRAQAAFADAWSEQAHTYLLRFHNVSGATGEGISSFTKRKLTGHALVSSDEVSRESMELFQAVFQATAKTFDPASMGDFQKKYLSLVNWWKAMAISTTGFIWRNTLGGFWLNNQIAGVPLSTHTRVLGIRYVAKKAGNGDVIAGLNKLVQDGVDVSLPAGFKIGSGFNTTVNVDELRFFRDWYSSGVAESGQVSQEISSVLDTMGAMGRKEKLAKGGTIKPWKAEFYPAAGVRILNQDAEFMLRGAVAHHTMMTGGTVDDAFRQAEKFHFNYSDLTNFERKAKMVVPFWTWQKNIIPVLVESMGKNPKAWARLQQVKGELELHSDEEGVVPDFFAENMGIRTPWKWNNDRVYVLPDLPFRDMSRWLKEADSPKDIWKSPARAMVESSLPWFKLPFELWAGKQTFADIPITGRYQQAPTWAEIPILKQVLQGMGILKENKNGQLKMRDNHIYTLDQFHPMLARIRRLVPNEEGKQERHFATIINTALGLGIRMNTPRAQRGQMISDQVEVSQTFRDMRDLEYRER